MTDFILQDKEIMLKAGDTLNISTPEGGQYMFEVVRGEAVYTMKDGKQHFQMWPPMPAEAREH
jgi:hypothetical protein